jgi:LPS sulfotransferase NodH
MGLSRAMIVPAGLRAIPSGHRQALEYAFGPLQSQPGWAPPARPMLYLCFTNRGGSNYLAQLLASTGAFNEAGEFFNAPTVLEHATRLGLRSLQAYVSALPSLVPKRRFLAAKASADQLAILADAGIISPATPFVLLERQDRLAQAISRVIARQTGQWTTAHSTTGSALIYDAAAITEELDKIAHGNAAFYAFFAANGIAPVHVTYEMTCRDPQGVIDLIAARMGAGPLRARPDRISIGRQATEINDRWAARYREESASF